MAMKMITQLIMWRVLMLTLALQVGALAADYLPAESAARQVLLGCTSKCGDVQIPYPFGIGDPPCFLESKFKLNCTTDSELYVASVRVLNISILKSQMDVAFFPSIACGLEKANVPTFYTAWLSISSEKNNFVTVGRDSYGYLNIFDDDGSSYSTGCLTRIGDRTFEDDGTCSGRGCCEVEIPPRVTNISIEASPFPKSTQAFKRASSHPIFAYSPLMAEALALREAMILATAMGIPMVVFESDSQTLIDVCKGKTIRGEIHTIVEDIHQIRANFENCCFTWVRREGNLPAHTIADLAQKGALTRNWKDHPPDLLRSAITRDMQKLWT